MQFFRYVTIVSVLAATAGCSTTQQITLGKSATSKRIATVAQVMDDGNSPQMDTNLEAALTKEGLTVGAKLPLGTKTTKDVDVLVSYVDVWRWDLVMYMKNLTVQLRDAETGDLLAIVQWSDSAFHGFRDAKLVTESAVTEMLTKVRATLKEK